MSAFLLGIGSDSDSVLFFDIPCSGMLSVRSSSISVAGPRLIDPDLLALFETLLPLDDDPPLDVTVIPLSSLPPVGSGQ